MQTTTDYKKGLSGNILRILAEIHADWLGSTSEPLFRCAELFGVELTALFDVGSWLEIDDWAASCVGRRNVLVSFQKRNDQIGERMRNGASYYEVITGTYAQEGETNSFATVGFKIAMDRCRARKLIHEARQRCYDAVRLIEQYRCFPLDKAHRGAAYPQYLSLQEELRAHQGDAVDLLKTEKATPTMKYPRLVDSVGAEQIAEWRRERMAFEAYRSQLERIAKCLPLDFKTRRDLDAEAYEAARKVKP